MKRVSRIRSLVILLGITALLWEPITSDKTEDDGVIFDDDDGDGFDEYNDFYNYYVDDCVDGDESCEMWAEMDECEANPGYMLDVCKKSCRVCGSVSHPQITNHTKQTHQHTLQTHHSKPPKQQKEPDDLVTETTAVHNHNIQNSESPSQAVPQFETSEVEWCRRNPTWRSLSERRLETQEPTRFKTQELLERCQTILHHKFDPDYLVRAKTEGLSSTFDSESQHFTSPSDEDDKSYFELPVLNRPLLRNLSTCMDDFLEDCWEDVTGTMIKPTISQTYRRQEDGLVVMAVVDNAITQSEADAISALSSCLTQTAPFSNEQRSFHDTDEGGGNQVTFLSGFLQLLAPGVAHRIRDTAHLVWSTVGWEEDSSDYGVFEPVDSEYAYYKDCELARNWVPEGWTDDVPHSDYSTEWFPDPLDRRMGIRTTEHLSYDLWGSLGFHEDSGSDYTVLMALADPEDYEGGHFSLCPEYDPDDPNYGGGTHCTNKISIKPKKLSAIVFLSNFNHGVEDIKSPGRVMFANELWRYGDVPAMVQRPTPEDFVFREESDDDDDDDDEYDDDHSQ